MRSPPDAYPLQPNLDRFPDPLTIIVVETTDSYFAALIESAHDAIIGMAIDGTITSWNAGAEQLYGYGAVEIVGRPISVVIPPESQQEIDWLRERLQQGEQIAPFETVRLRCDGRRIDVWIAISPIKNEHGLVVGVSSIVRNITAPKRAEEAQRRLRALLEYGSDVVSESSGRGNVTYVSPSIERVLGYTADEFRLLPPWILIHPDDLPELERVAADLLTKPGTTLGWQARYRHKDGSWRWMEGSATNLLEDSSRFSIVWNFRDVTDRKRREEEIQRVQIALAQRVTEQMTDLSAANELLKAQLAQRQYAGRGQTRRAAAVPAHIELDVIDVAITGRLQWTATSCLMLALGILVVRYLHPLLDATPDINTGMYASLTVWVLASGLLAIGLLPTKPRLISVRIILGLVALLGGLSSLVIIVADSLPRLVRLAPGANGGTPSSATAWHYALSALPFSLALVAAVGLLRQPRHEPAGRWLIASLVFWTAAQLYDVLWPAVYAYPPYPADVLRLAAAAAVAAALLAEFFHLSTQRAALLTAEREYSKRLGELNIFKADFTAMVAHELGSPIAAIRHLATFLDTGEVSPADQRQLLHTIKNEAELLESLVADVRASARAERDDFTVRLQQIPVATLLAEAAASASSLPGGHPVTTTVATSVPVLVDPERIAQVLQNLLGNAAKYAPAGSPVELRAIPDGRFIRIEVADRGPGVHPDDHERIFEKFGRGRLPTGQHVPGTGVGLYLARRIICAHGSELTVASRPGGGSVFAFRLEVAP